MARCRSICPAPVFLCLLLLLNLAFAEISSPSSTSIIQSTVARKIRISTLTARNASSVSDPIVPAPEVPEPLNRTGSNFLGPLPQALQAFEFKTYIGEDFSEVGYSTHTLCWYPVSGNYGTLPRILLYFTLIFAVVARNQEWLIAGALTAGLTYSGTAAIHACLLLWHGSAWGDLDALGLYAVLSSSCLVVVPLLNWSSTIRNLGRIGLKKGPTRAIFLYWSLLVGTGFICTFIMYGGDGPSASWGLYTWSGTENIRCTPRGDLNLSAGQVPSWTGLVLDLEFIQTNNCEDPCSTSFSPNPAFRTDSDLQIVTRREREFLDSWFFRTEFENSPAKHDVTDAGYFHYVTFGIWSIVSVVAQGIYAACFGRSTPAQARNLLYRILRSKSLGIRFAKFVAIFAYLLAVVIPLLCPVIFLLNLATVEIYLSNFPESDPLIHVGAWSPWAATGLVLFAALVSRHHEAAVRVLRLVKKQIAKWSKGVWGILRLRNASHPSRSINLIEPNDSGSRSVNNARRLYSYKSSANRQMLGMIVEKFVQENARAICFLKTEYRMFAAFWKDPENNSLHSSSEDNDVDTMQNTLYHMHTEKNEGMIPSRSATFVISRNSTMETLVNQPRADIEGRDSSSRDVSTPPPLPAIPKPALAKSSDRISIYPVQDKDQDSPV